MDHHIALAGAMGWPLSACISDYGDLKRDGVDADLERDFVGGAFIETFSDNEA
jgi:hypothetical protein